MVLIRKVGRARTSSAAGALTRMAPETFAAVGASAYVIGAFVPFQWNLPWLFLGWDVPLAVLVLSVVLAAMFDRRPRWLANPRVVYSVIGFLLVMAASVLFSNDVGRSARLTIRLLPAVLLFFAIATYVRGTRARRVLYATLSLGALGLALVLIRVASASDDLSPRQWIADAGSPMLIVPNDVIFLAVVAPFSVALAHRGSSGLLRTLAGLSVVATVSAVCAVQSRLGLLTCVAAVALTAGLLWRRSVIGWAAGIAFTAVLVDGLAGFPLLAKFGRLGMDALTATGGGRISAWRAAWSMFVQAPWWGHGPHTFVYTDPDGMTMRWPHNIYLEVLAEHGILALAALAVMLGCGVTAAWQIYRTADGDVRASGAAAGAALLSFCGAGIFESSLLRQWVVVTLFVLLGTVAELSPAPAAPRGDR
jgi:O-antigen ligase